MLNGFEMIAMDEVTFHAPTKSNGRTEINVSLNGKPFGQMWTFKAKGETHPWHAKPLNGEHATFWGRNGKKEAMDYMRAAI